MAKAFHYGVRFRQRLSHYEARTVGPQDRCAVDDGKILPHDRLFCRASPENRFVQLRPLVSTG